MAIFNSPKGIFQLSRYPARKKEQLRAWDAADEYLLNYFSVNYNGITKTNNILIVNDSFGALTIALSQYNLTLWNDSVLAQEGIRQNFIDNTLLMENVKFKNSLDDLEGAYDFVLIKIPKSLAFLEQQLIQIKKAVQTETKIIAAAMTKSIHTSTLKLFEKYIGFTKTSLAKKKSRLIFCQPDDNIKSVTSPYPKSYKLENTNFSIVNYANVFSRESLDIGTRFFLKHIPQSERYKTIIDLGCGNGVVGLIAADKNPQAEIMFLDSSFMAIASAQETWCSLETHTSKVSFKVNDCLAGIEKGSVELILNNPPFHQDNAVGDEVAWKMFQQSKDVLKCDGELFVIGNRHLGYHIKLNKIFGNCEVVASNKRFIILKSIKGLVNA